MDDLHLVSKMFGAILECVNSKGSEWSLAISSIRSKQHSTSDEQMYIIQMDRSNDFIHASLVIRNCKLYVGITDPVFSILRHHISDNPFICYDKPMRIMSKYLRSHFVNVQHFLNDCKKNGVLIETTCCDTDIAFRVQHILRSSFVFDKTIDVVVVKKLSG